MKHYINPADGALYVLADTDTPHDREATAEEVAVYEVSKQPKAIDQIRALEAAPTARDAEKKATRQLLLGTWFAKVKAMPAAAAMTDAQIEAYCRANDKTYKTLAELEDAVKPLRLLVV